MNFNHLAEPIISSYLYTSVYNSQEENDDAAADKKGKLRGGCPVNKLYNLASIKKLIVGGNVDEKLAGVEDEKSGGGQLDDYVVPVGLVYISSASSCNNVPSYYDRRIEDEFENKPSYHELIQPVPTNIYDSLIDSIAYNKIGSSPIVSSMPSASIPESSTPVSSTPISSTPISIVVSHKKIENKSADKSQKKKHKDRKNKTKKIASSTSASKK
jgi:hypothetical protein